MLLCLLLASSIFFDGVDARTAIMTSNGVKSCSAVLVKQDVALTAAHCVGNKLNGSPIKKFHRLDSVDLAVVILEAPAIGLKFQIAEGLIPFNQAFFKFKTRVPLYRGDSGSPIFKDGKLIGILIGKPRTEKRTGIAVNLSRYKRWIENQTE